MDSCEAGCDTPTNAFEVSILHITDTHCFEDYQLPPADVLLHTGDFTNHGEEWELEKFDRWLGSIKHQYKEIYVITGNHEWWGRDEGCLTNHIWSLWRAWQLRCVKDLDDAVRAYLQRHLTNARVLEHELVATSYGGVNIYASSWCPWLDPSESDRGRWHWGASEKVGGGLQREWPLYKEVWAWLWRQEFRLPMADRKLKVDLSEVEQAGIEQRMTTLPDTFFAYSWNAGTRRWQEEQTTKEEYLQHNRAPEARYHEIPEGVDILMTHGGSLQRGRRIAWGSSGTLIQMIEAHKPKVHLYGHHHSGFGTCWVGGTLRSNASGPDDKTQHLDHPYGILLKARSSEQGFQFDVA